MKIALPAMPILWKKFVATIWNPMIGKQRKTMRMPSAASRTSSSSVVKSDTARWGMNSPTTKPEEVTHTAHTIVSRSTLSTRSYCCAPKLYPAMGCIPWLMPMTIMTKMNARRFTMP